MKKSIIKQIIAIFLFLFFVSCKKDDVGKTDGSTIPTSFEINVDNAAATIKIPNLIEVVIPQGAFSGTATFKVVSVQASTLPAPTDFDMFETFEITSTSGKTFAKDLEITIKYDPTKGQKDAILNGAAFYHEDSKKWIPFGDVTVDATKSEIKIKSNHLTKLGRFSYTKALGYTHWSSSLHFFYYWSEPGVQGNSQYISPYKDVNVGTDPHYIQDISSYMEAAHKAFKDANLTLPSGKINVYIKKLDKGTDGMTTFLGNIYINENIGNSNYATTGEILPSVCAHELLHYVQDYYYMQLFSDYTVKWWLEATAVQADRFVWPSNKKCEVIEYAQILYQNLSTPWDDCNSDPNFYIAGNFLSYLIYFRPVTKLSLPEIIIGGGKATNLSFMRTILDQMVKTKLGSPGIGEEYANFIKWAIEGKSEIKLIPERPTPTPVYPNFRNSIFTTKSQKETKNANVPRLSVGFFKGLNNVKEKLEMIAKLDTKSDQLVAWAYKMNNNGTATFLKELKAKDSVIVELTDMQEWAEIICVNKTKDDEGTASVSFSFNLQPRITAITPSKAKAGELVTIQGANLGASASSSIYINNQLIDLAKNLKSWANTLIEFTVPDNASSGDVYVKTSNIPSNKLPFEFIKSPPQLDMVGVNMSMANFNGYQAWGGFDQYATKLYIMGKNWSRDPAKTTVKVNGNVVPIIDFSGTTLPADKLVIGMPNIEGNISVTVVSEGLESDPKIFYRGIPLNVLQKMPLSSFKNQIRLTYNDYRDGNKVTIHSVSKTISNNQIDNFEYKWVGNVLTINGNGLYLGSQTVVLTFNEFGTKVNTVEYEVKALNDNWKLTVNDLNAEIISGGYQLRFSRTAIASSAYKSVSGSTQTTAPVYVFPITGVAENESYWPNEVMLWFEFKN